MSKELTTLNVSLESESHVYTWKQTSVKSMFFLWLISGGCWLFLLYFYKTFNWGLSNWGLSDFIFFAYWIWFIPYILYLLVLKTSIKINSDKLLTAKTPFNLFAKNLKLEDINLVYYQKSTFNKGNQIIAELKNGKSVKLLFGLEEKQAIELAQYIDSSRKHFQHLRLVSTNRGISDFGD